MNGKRGRSVRERERSPRRPASILPLQEQPEFEFMEKLRNQKLQGKGGTDAL